ncbi:TetR/AcrR family transcriptional regulator [Rhodococcus opacus]|nr:TetR family transcriptional regulator [Rhodococcus wratislaviensis IFP 2016]RKM76426.1 TetR/AcrR family transcriptional regulator [Rhodococcus opacus]
MLVMRFVRTGTGEVAVRVARCVEWYDMSATTPTGKDPVRSSLREVQKDLTRERLTEAALTAFREQGYDLATADYIAKLAGASRATFYLHFKGKAELVLELLDRLEPTVVAAYRDLDELRHAPRSKIHKWVVRETARWGADSGRFEALDRAAAVERKVQERWFLCLERSADAMTGYLSEFPSGTSRRRARQNVLMQMITMERGMFLSSVRGLPLDSKLLLESLTDQWSSVLGSAGNPSTR